MPLQQLMQDDPVEEAAEPKAEQNARRSRQCACLAHRTFQQSMSARSRRRTGRGAVLTSRILQVDGSDGTIFSSSHLGEAVERPGSIKPGPRHNGSSIVTSV